MFLCKMGCEPYLKKKLVLLDLLPLLLESCSFIIHILFKGNDANKLLEQLICEGKRRRWSQ